MSNLRRLITLWITTTHKVMGFPLLPLPSQTHDRWRIEETFDEQPCRSQGASGERHPSRSGDDFRHESFLGWQLCSPSGQPAW
jgi:hypothetical protein